VAGNWFIGLPIAATPWLAGVIADAPPGLRLFHPDDVHITVAFLGRAGEVAAGRAFDLVEAPAAPIQVTLGGLKAFGNPRRPSALSVVLAEGHDEVAALIGRLRDPLIAAAGARPEARVPSPHITIARPAMRAGPAERRAAVAWAEGKPPVSARLTIDRIALYAWSEDRKLRQFRSVKELRWTG
jgi:2'-5' RNA ligase